MNAVANKNLVDELREWVKLGRVRVDGMVRVYNVGGGNELRGTNALVDWLVQHRPVEYGGLNRATIASFINRQVTQLLGKTYVRGPNKPKRKSPRLLIAWPIPVGARYVLSPEEPKFK